MRIYLFITLLLSFTNAEARNQCSVYLSKDSIIKSSDLNKVLFEAPPTVSPANRVLEKTDSIISLSLELRLLTQREAKHLRDDIKELASEPNVKENQAGFNDIISRWEPMIVDVESKLKEFKALPKNEQRQWKSKMELPVYFATGHFIVFLETRNKKFDYSKISNILEALEGKGVKDDLKLYLFVFEKQVRRFFSVKEFRRCKA